MDDRGVKRLAARANQLYIENESNRELELGVNAYRLRNPALQFMLIYMQRGLPSIHQHVA